MGCVPPDYSGPTQWHTSGIVEAEIEIKLLPDPELFFISGHLRTDSVLFQTWLHAARRRDGDDLAPAFVPGCEDSRNRVCLAP